MSGIIWSKAGQVRTSWQKWIDRLYLKYSCSSFSLAGLWNMSKEKAVRSKQKEYFLDGRTRRPHSRTCQALRKSFEKVQPSSVRATGVCVQCYPVLSHHADTFKGMVHQGTELKKKKVYPYPKHPESELVHYHDITKQNEWLRENVFDSLGNYLYCCSCIRASLLISNDRIAHQRSIK